MSDKIRFYLEKSVAELEDLDRKGLFTKTELSTIMKKRTDLEHRINSRTSKPSDFIKYAEYEINVEKLRRKRIKRLGQKTGPNITGVSDYSGPKRVLFIYDRATRKFSGDISLWLLYIEYAKQVKAVHVVTKVFTRLLQLHPVKPQVWILAAKYEMEDNASMKTARSIMQRGLRFNFDQPIMWLEYIKLELIYVSKILARRQLLGLEKSRYDSGGDNTATASDQDDSKNGNNHSHVELSEVLTNEDLIKADLGSLPEADMSMLGNPQTNPALRGDVVLAIFDAAVENIKPSDTKFSFALQVLQLIDQFSAVDQPHLASHIIDYIKSSGLEASSTKAMLLAATLPIRYVSHSDPGFPDLIKLLVVNYKNTTNKKVLGPLLSEYIDEKFLIPTLDPELDSSLRKALELLKKKFI